MASILILTSSAAVLLEGAVIGATFCLDPDGNAVKLLHNNVKDATFVNTSRFYITGEGSNVFFDQLNASAAFLQSPPYIPSSLDEEQISNNCVEADEMIHQLLMLNDILASVTTKVSYGIDQAHKLLDPKTIYPLYTQGVHENLCTELPELVLALVVTQTLFGIVLLPILLLSSGCWLTRWERWSRPNAAVGNDMLPEEIPQP